MEIERKFRVDGRSAEAVLAAAPRAQAVEQGYLTSEPVEVRLRRIDGRTLMTAKRGSGAVREEVEVEVDRAAFDLLWPLTERSRVGKRRHRVGLGDDLVAEVDVYEGSLAGLITAEVEFPSEHAASEFAAPEWFGEELTGDSRYSNASLAVRGDPEPAR